MLRALSLFAALAVTAACDQGQPVTYATAAYAPARAPSDAAAAGFAHSFLDSIQARSIAAGREMCGYFYVTRSGQIAATPPQMGGPSGCAMYVPQSGQGIFASYHTHGAAAPGYDTEVPSALDLLNDFELGLDGYVSTPGGRFWHIDVSSRTTRLLCGPACMTYDPTLRGDGRPILPVYDVTALQQRAARAF